LSGAWRVGLIRNNTTAVIGGNVTATQDVQVHALSRVRGDSFIGGLGVSDTGISIVISAGLYSVRASFDPIFGLDLLGFLTGSGVTTVQSTIDSQLFQLANSGQQGIGGLLNQYAQGVGGGAQSAASAISTAAPHPPPPPSLHP